MGKVPVRTFTHLDHEIVIVRERRNLPPLSKFEPRLGVEVRYGLKFDGQITDWSEFVEATNDEASANHMAELGLQRAQALSKQERALAVSPAA
ncbi:hypothetical protein GCM10010840_14390 [Deinococcus aerolatus]|uniref:Uncharacterized protein n=1 Tax=Deinococcus aerolatus TaxID=522487 RepID=A0ABQ2G6K0_9DEIO|nr:hypothetical protein [Deinococcus aerolatus]GGL77560.1 hypothetical protein GCM10010840_14390 [Deinococcus aerolatus]